MVELLESSFNSKDLKVDLSLDSALDKPKASRGSPKDNPIRVDKGQIEQVLVNLILNAVDASRPRKRLSIGTKLHTHKVEFRITDHGVGITEKDLANIFKPFFTTKVDGIGLGLYISHLIVVDSHHGKIDVRSEPGKGTTFIVFLPIN